MSQLNLLILEFSTNCLVTLFEHKHKLQFLKKNLLKLIIIGIFNELLSLASLRRLFIRDFQAPCKIHKTKSEGVIEYVFIFSARCKTLPGK